MHSMAAMKKIDIAALRKRLGGISQGELGRRLGGLSQSAVSRLEAGATPQDGPVGVLLRQLWESTQSKAA